MKLNSSRAFFFGLINKIFNLKGPETAYIKL
jgi:hypothetical protein